MTSNNINWKFILNKIQEEKCILMLGPDVIVAEREGSLYYNLNKYLTEIHHDKEDLVYYSEDEFFSFKDVRQQLETYDNMFTVSRKDNGLDLIDKGLSSLIWQTSKDKKELRFTAVIDCCHSCRVTRTILENEELSRTLFVFNELFFKCSVNCNAATHLFKP